MEPSTLAYHQPLIVTTFPLTPLGPSCCICLMGVATEIVRKGNIHVRQNDIESVPDPAQLPVTHHYQPPTSPDDYDPVHQFESGITELRQFF